MLHTSNESDDAGGVLFDAGLAAGVADAEAFVGCELVAVELFAPLPPPPQAEIAIADVRKTANPTQAMELRTGRRIDLTPLRSPSRQEIVGKR
jgi:hypothetical protein